MSGEFCFAGSISSKLCISRNVQNGHRKVILNSRIQFLLWRPAQHPTRLPSSCVWHLREAVQLIYGAELDGALLAAELGALRPGLSERLGGGRQLSARLLQLVQVLRSLAGGGGDAVLQLGGRACKWGHSCT